MVKGFAGMAVTSPFAGTAEAPGSAFCRDNDESDGPSLL